MPNVKFDKVTFRYGSNLVLDNFSLEIDESRIMGIVGPSGCGKTTLIRCLCGFIKPEKGNIYIGDSCIFSADKKINISPEKRNIGVVFQDYAVWPHMTVYENVEYPLKKRKIPRNETAAKVAYALDQVRMTGYEKHLPSQLSGGQQQRVAIARALVSSDGIIVLDEPITNLDLKLREEMLEEIRRIQMKIGTTIIYITHDQEAAIKLCDMIAIMDTDGKLCQIGTDEEIVYKPASRFVFSFIGISNFVPVIKKEDELYINAGKMIKIPNKIPPEIKEGKDYVMGIRPMDILFNDTSPVKGKILSSTFLGNQYNYFVLLGDQEIRVQESIMDAFQTREYQEGETVGLDFARSLYYEETSKGVTA